MRSTLLHRLDARDRALFVRLSRDATGPWPRRRWWTALSHLGGARASIALCIVPFLLRLVSLSTAWNALLALGISHAVVQVVKRTVGRPRPATRLSIVAMMHEPDRFSFPSGHACAAMAVATAFAWAFPAASVPLFVAAMLVGLSRVVVGVHYPGDVLVGQAIALLTAYAVCAWRIVAMA
jgi:undecaprenyl-diphosphatase